MFKTVNLIKIYFLECYGRQELYDPLYSLLLWEYNVFQVAP